MVQRQPVRVRGRRSAADVLSGLFALLVLSALVAGVPAALLTFVESPISELQQISLSDQIHSEEILAVITYLVWLVWAQLVFCLIVEVRAGVRGIGVPMRVPLAGATQAIVHRLVVAILLLFTATTAIMPAFAHQAPARPQLTTTALYDPMPAHKAAGHLNGQVMTSAPAAGSESATETTKIYRVNPPHGRHHESLWEIAEKCLGDGRRYKEIYALNKGHVQPDGSQLREASLIRPGWIMQMPPDAQHTMIIPKSDLHDYYQHGHPVPDHPKPPKPKPEPERPVQPKPVPAPTQEQKPVPAPTQERQKPAPAPPQKPVETERPAPMGRPSTHEAGPRAEAQQAPAEEEAFPWPEALAGTSLLAAGLLTALGRRRRAQAVQRSFGRMVLGPEGEAALAEQALRIGAEPEAVRALDLGLRLLSRGLARQGRTLPTVYGVHLGSESLDLWIAPMEGDPPEPWETHDNGQVWRLHLVMLEQVDIRSFSDVLAPYPGLISIGTNDNGRVLADLEAAHGLIALDGAPEQRKEALAAIAVELATSAWSDHMRLTLVGFGDDLREIAPDRIRCVGSLAEALPELEARTAEVRQALQASGADSVLTGRCRGVFGEAWMPHYLIMAEQPTKADGQRLVELARTGQRLSAGFLVAGEVEGATWTWNIDEDGVLHAGVLGFEVDAQRIPERQYRAVADLFRTAGRLEGKPLPVPTNEFGANDQVASAHIKVLGRISIDAPGPIDEARRELCTEVLVYLATHPGGVHPTLLSKAIWPRGVPAGTRDATIAMAADWVGRDSRGRPNLYYDDRGRIKLGSEVRVDWQTFRYLVWRSAAEPAAEPAYLSQALSLVQGPLMAARPRGRYTWLATDDLEYETTARVVDVAHRLVLTRMDEGDPRAAVAAARSALRLAPDDEILWRDLLRATDATADQTAVAAVIEELRGRADLDLLQPETEALIDELSPHAYIRGA